ncbi:MAG: hypothetical protein PWP24_1920 [Clostridiales bacterium]|nr:hypothetical protein [Clostridiales bacterium]
MDIAALSMAMSQSNTMTQVGTAMLGKSLETVATQGDSMVNMMEQSVTPELGQTIDLKL